MTCNDCLYGEKCYSRIRHFMDVDEGTGKLIQDIEKRCPSFKNKADFVEAVRCKDCAYWDKRTTNNKGFVICPASGMEIHTEDFCSYGERKQ